VPFAFSRFKPPPDKKEAGPAKVRPHRIAARCYLQRRVGPISLGRRNGAVLAGGGVLRRLTRRTARRAADHRADAGAKRSADRAAVRPAPAGSALPADPPAAASRCLAVGSDSVAEVVPSAASPAPSARSPAAPPAAPPTIAPTPEPTGPPTAPPTTAPVAAPAA